MAHGHNDDEETVRDQLIVDKHHQSLSMQKNGERKQREVFFWLIFPDNQAQQML